jgi:hypothetical protein
MRTPGVGNLCDGGSRSCDVRVRMCRPRRRGRYREPARARDTRRELGTRRIAIWRARLPNRRMGRTPPGSDRDNAPGPSRRVAHRFRSGSCCTDAMVGESSATERPGAARRTACCGVRRGARRGHRTYSSLSEKGSSEGATSHRVPIDRRWCAVASALAPASDRSKQGKRVRAAPVRVPRLEDSDAE